MKTLSKALLAVTTMAACTNAITDHSHQQSVDPFQIKPFILPESFKDDLNNYRSQWIRLTGFDFSGLHWNQFVVVYANKGADIYKKNYLAYLNAYQDEDEDEDEEEENFVSYEPGTIFVKESYLATKGHPTTPLTLSTMIKHKPGYDPKNGDWEYLQSSVDGKILVQGKAEDPLIFKLCGECHMNVAERDFIFSTFYSEPKKTQ